MNRRFATIVCLLIAGGCVPGSAAPILTLNPPGGALTGSPGQTVGYGFTITNDTTFYLLFDASYFCQPGQDPASTTCTQILGTYHDFIAGNGTEVSPMGSLTQSFNVNTMTGFGAYTILPAVLVGATDSGRLVGTYMEYEGDPFNGGTQVSGDIEIAALASVTVIGAVPEPSGGILMIVAGLGGLMGLWPTICNRRKVGQAVSPNATYFSGSTA